MKTKILAVIFCLALPLPAFAGWVGPKVVVSGTWGKGPGQFGLEGGDGFDQFPDLLAITTTGKVIIGDSLNKRIQVFTPSGKFINSFSFQEMPEYIPSLSLWPLSLFSSSDQCIATQVAKYTQIYNINGDLLHNISNVDAGLERIQDNCNFYTRNPSNNVYKQYSPTGTLLQAYTSRPQELGVWTFKCNQGIPTLESCKKLHFEVEYPNAVYVYDQTKSEFKSDLQNQVRITNNLIMDNQKESVYAYGVTSTIPAVNGQKEKRYLGWKTTWQKPANSSQGAEPIKTPDGTILEYTRPTTYNIYGEPVIGPDGSIYTWMRSETHYKIIKWTWKD